ncbi:hypothetical protein MLC59_02090 [Marinobacter bryozoorum]|uniref:hypothetical protein n=1 Tax=Marinobacter bryozoorum TaxID=256324 RepID=UPI0020046500|nr:hypothetical protein [Marinobacter bryozoorum]MCK7542960.1 hypothetical protein [Marinobacter bryozoorum]
MSDYLKALRERKRTLKIQQERHDAQLEALEERARQIVEDAKAQAQAERDQILADAKGDPGEDGDVGPMPKHQWKGTRLRFEDGERDHWGKWVDLKGQPGPPGPPGRPGSGANLASLPLLNAPPEDGDTMIVEREGKLYRVTIQNLKDTFGEAIPIDAIYAGGDPVMADDEYVRATD